MKAYKCDLCGYYCDDVLTIHGLAQPINHCKFHHLDGTSADCCEVCYDKVMVFVAKIMQEPSCKHTEVHDEQ